MSDNFEEYSTEEIHIYGAREHNLKNIDLIIPRNKLVVFTGLSGSGKSSLAFDTLYAEGQRRYMESFSAYARQFIGNMERPDVDKITGLCPVISIEQKTTNRNIRSTVGTLTEIYDFMRLLYARIGEAHSYNTGEKMVRYTEAQIVSLLLEKLTGKQVYLLAPVVKGRKGHYREHFEQIRKQGFLKVRVDGKICELTHGMQLDRYKIHDIEIVIDTLTISNGSMQRVSDSVKTALKTGKGIMMVVNTLDNSYSLYSKYLMCPTTGISYQEPEPNSFSFNSPYGACPRCNGLGVISTVDIAKIIPDARITIKKGGIIPLGEYKPTWIFKQIEAIGIKFGFNLDSPIEDIPEKAINIILYGTDEVLKIKNDYVGVTYNYKLNFEGIVNFITNQGNEATSESVKKWASEFMNNISCPDCQGARLKKESLHFLIDNKNISDLANLDISEFHEWLNIIEKKLSAKQLQIATEILKELRNRVTFLLNVGLNYLSINRNTNSLSGGESQRIRLATQIGSQLVNVLYILDEPSIGLHQCDNVRLINSLKNLRDIGNSVIVVEHDQEMIMASDYIIDIGPGAGIHGGKIVAKGTPEEILKSDGITAHYLSERKKILIPEKRRKGNGLKLTISGATGNNLKNVTVNFPLGKMICVTGVSGSGKSSLITSTLYPILSKHFYRSTQQPLPYKSIKGLEHIDKVIEIDQSPIGRTSRSNPATYTKVFDEIRKLFCNIPEAKIRGYLPGRFSFNVKGGRCETCQGGGMKVIEMNFLPDVYVQCEDCQGKRYNRETLEIRYKGKSINDVLNMTIDQAVEFFENIPAIRQKIKSLLDVGLSYITLGQQSTTFSGGEAQRVKLATELSKRDTGNTFYILDEPTTGLHFEDINVLLNVLNRLMDKGNTILIIEHNLDVIKVCDHIIDLGPDGGNKGGNIVCEGSPEEICKNKTSYTSHFLRNIL